MLNQARMAQALKTLLPNQAMCFCPLSEQPAFAIDDLHLCDCWQKGSPDTAGWHLVLSHVCRICLLQILLACSSPGIHNTIAAGLSSFLLSLIVWLTGTLRSCRAVSAAKQCPKQHSAANKQHITGVAAYRCSHIPAGR